MLFRSARFKSHGSVREIMDWDEMCKVELPVPSIDKQRSIVKAYQTITERIELKRRINDNLAATIQTIFLSCKQSDTFKTYLPLNELVKTVNFRNKDNVYGIDDLMGVSLTKEFIKSPANTISLDVSNYKIVKPFQFACNLMHVGRDKKVAVGMLTDADNVIISPAFTVFEIINNNVILPEVLVSWFSQSFFDNEVSYLASEGIRDGIKWHDGEPFTADDVKFTIEAIMDPDNGSENAPRDLSERCEESSAGEVEDCNQASDKESLRVWREIIWHQQKSIWILLWNNYQDWMKSAVGQ